MVAGSTPSLNASEPIFDTAAIFSSSRKGACDRVLAEGCEGCELQAAETVSKMANMTPSKPNKRTGDDQVTPKTSKKAKPELYDDQVTGIMPKTLDGGVKTADVMAKYCQVNTYNGLMRDLAQDQPLLAEWVAVALAWTREKGTRGKGALEDGLSPIPWWTATKKQRQKALSIHFN